MCAGRERVGRSHVSGWKVAGSGGLPPISGQMPTATVRRPSRLKAREAAHGWKRMRDFKREGEKNEKAGC